MKKVAAVFSLMIGLYGSMVYGQDVPVPAAADPVAVPVESAPVSAESAALQETADQSAPVEDAGTRMIAFFDGLEKTVQGDDCRAIADAMRAYCQAHQDWIDALDYATGNLDRATIEAVHEKATSLGKKLSVCYDEPAIPELLRRYAGLGQAQ